MFNVDLTGSGHSFGCCSVPWTRLLLELDNLFDYFTNIYISVGEGYGILEDDYDTIRHPWKLEQLQSLMPILSDHTEGL